MAKPGLYLQSPTLFPWGKKKKSKVLDRSVSMPDPQKEDINPDEDEGIASVMTGDEDLSRGLTKGQEATQILKSMTEPEEPDMTGKLEGKFKVSVEEMVVQLNRIVSAEYSEWMRWYHYALVLKGHARGGIVKEFEEHAEDELEHIDKIALRVVALGGYPATTMEHPKPLTEREDILKELIFREQEGIKLYREVLELCGDNAGTRVLIEANIEKEQEHLDELWRWLKGEDVEKAQEDAGYHIDIPHYPHDRAEVVDYEGTKLDLHKDGTVRHPKTGKTHGTYTWEKPTKGHGATAFLRVRPKWETSLYESSSQMDKAGADQESAGRRTFPSEVQAKRERERSYQRFPTGISGGTTPDLPEVGRDWHSDEEENEEAEEAANKVFGPPEDVFGLKKKKPASLGKSLAVSEAKMVLDSVPRFREPHSFSPREREFLLEKGFSEAEIASGSVDITPKMCEQFRHHLRGHLSKSLGSLQSFRRK